MRRVPCVCSVRARLRPVRSVCDVHCCRMRAIAVERMRWREGGRLSAIGRARRAVCVCSACASLTVCARAVGAARVYTVVSVACDCGRENEVARGGGALRLAALDAPREPRPCVCSVCASSTVGARAVGAARAVYTVVSVLRVITVEREWRRESGWLPVMRGCSRLVTGEKTSPPPLPHFLSSVHSCPFSL